MFCGGIMLLFNQQVRTDRDSRTAISPSAGRLMRRVEQHGCHLEIEEASLFFLLLPLLAPYIGGHFEVISLDVVDQPIADADIDIADELVRWTIVGQCFGQFLRHALELDMGLFVY